MINRLLKTLAFIIRPLNFPHPVKFLLFLLIRSRNIPVRPSIKISNARMDLNLGNFIDYWIFMDGSYEEKWIKKIEKLVKKKTFIDVGANIGIYPLSLFKKAKYIYAFEPEEENYKRLEQNIKINRITNIKSVKKAVSDKNGVTATLYINRKDKGWSSLMMRHKDGKELVKLTSLDYFLTKNKTKNIGLIKIDVEGAELNVLRGALKTLQRFHPPVLVEFNDTFSRLSGYNVIELYKLMEKLNYRAFWLKDNRLLQLGFTQIYRGINENVLFMQ